MPHRFRRLAVAALGAVAFAAGAGTVRGAMRPDPGAAATAAAPAGRYAVAGTWTARSAAFGPVRGDYTGVVAVIPVRRGPGCFGVFGAVTYTMRDARGHRIGRFVAPGGEICLRGRPGARTHTLRPDLSVRGRAGPVRIGPVWIGPVRGEGRFVGDTPRFRAGAPDIGAPPR